MHKGLKRLYAQGDPKGVPVQAIKKLVNILSFLQDMETLDELTTLPMWKVHQMKGDRKGTWSLSATRNWRLTFRYYPKENEIYDMNFENYH
ncbi:MAG: type II toxin-antitoxin system RelE/ParE family toxin [Thermodesulfobacteriota bacterium]